MRVSKKAGELKVVAIAGTYVVMMGFDLPEDACDGLLGFSIHRTDHDENEAYYLSAMKAFAETDPGFPAGAEYSTRDHPIQSFQWADYSAKPGHRYTYVVSARKGAPAALTTFAEVSFEVTTECPEGGDHDVYFNRGVAASQEYVRRFGNRKPDMVPNGAAFTWLSRGLFEAMCDYVESADPNRDALLIAAYEFNYMPFLEVVKAAVDRGVDVRVCYDGREKGENNLPGEPSREAIAAVGLNAVCAERKTPKSMISHNKFIVKLRDGEPISVWTGGTNFSRGGIFGHSNVAHVVEEKDIAQQFLEYWELLSDDPGRTELRGKIEATNPLPPGTAPPAGTTAIFSPRDDLSALALYATYAKQAQHGLMMTFAFGMNDVFKEVYRSSPASFRLALMEKKTRPMKAGSPERLAEEAAIQQLRNMPENVFAIGDAITNNAIEGWARETVSGFNGNVKYVHNKFMLIDPMSDEPIVIAGSANFSAASTTGNDENMIVVRGNKRVADIYLGEFMRLWTHHAFRESLAWRKPGEPPKPLSTGDWWRDSFGNTPRSTRREYFTF